MKQTWDMQTGERGTYRIIILMCMLAIALLCVASFPTVSATTSSSASSSSPSVSASSSLLLDRSWRGVCHRNFLPAHCSPPTLRLTFIARGLDKQKGEPSAEQIEEEQEDTGLALVMEIEGAPMDYPATAARVVFRKRKTDESDDFLMLYPLADAELPMLPSTVPSSSTAALHRPTPHSLLTPLCMRYRVSEGGENGWEVSKQMAELHVQDDGLFLMQLATAIVIDEDELASAGGLHPSSMHSSLSPSSLPPSCFYSSFLLGHAAHASTCPVGRSSASAAEDDTPDPLYDARSCFIVPQQVRWAQQADTPFRTIITAVDEKQGKKTHRQGKKQRTNLFFPISGN